MFTPGSRACLPPRNPTRGALQFPHSCLPSRFHRILTMIPCDRRLCFLHPSQRPECGSGSSSAQARTRVFGFLAPAAPPCTHKPSTQDGSHTRCGDLWPTGSLSPVDICTWCRLPAAHSPVFQALWSPPTFPGRRGCPAPRGGQFGANVVPTYETTSALGRTVELLSAVS